MLHLPPIHVTIGKEGALWLPSPWVGAFAMLRCGLYWHAQNLRNMKFWHIFEIKISFWLMSQDVSSAEAFQPDFVLRFRPRPPWPKCETVRYIRRKGCMTGTCEIVWVNYAVQCRHMSWCCAMSDVMSCRALKAGEFQVPEISQVFNNLSISFQSFTLYFRAALRSRDGEHIWIC